eukprot:s11107_g1.t1
MQGDVIEVHKPEEISAKVNAYLIVDAKAMFDTLSKGVLVSRSKVGPIKCEDDDGSRRRKGDDDDGGRRRKDDDGSRRRKGDDDDGGRRRKDDDGARRRKDDGDDGGRRRKDRTQQLVWVSAQEGVVLVGHNLYGMFLESICD